jgi:dipeptidyl aminopeptidase/acylaminoacyl peptidase
MWVRGGALVAQRVAENLRQLEGDVKPLVQPVGEDYSVSQNGILIYRSAPATENHVLLWFDRSGKSRGEAFPGPSSGLPGIRLSPDDRRVVFNRLDEAGLSDLWEVELSRGRERRLTFGAAQGGGGWGVWSPDGSELVLNVLVSGTRRLARLSSSGRSLPALFADNQIPSFGQFPHDWSPDSRFVAFVNIDASFDIWILPLAPGEKSWPLLATPFNEDHPQFSPDGHWLAYYSDESGRDEVYIQRFPKLGDKVAVSSGGGSQPRWRRDGKELFFVTLDGRLMAAPVKMSDGRLEVGEPKPLFRMPLRLAPNQYTYDVSADGQRFLAMAPAQQARPEPLKVMSNWKAALK